MPKQFFETFPVRIKGDATMYIHMKVGPYLMNILDLVIGDNFFKEYLDPGGHTYDDTDVPIRSFPGDLIQFCIPFACAGDSFSRLIEMLKPERKACSLDAAQV